MPVALGLDVGERRIGIAVAGASGVLASPLTTVIRTSDKAAVEAIGRLVLEHEAELLVVGLPLTERGATSAQAERIERFSRKLRAIPRVRVVFWDERYSTGRAAESLLASGQLGSRPKTARRREAQRRRLDAAAAAVILQDYLDLNQQLQSK